MPTKPITTSPAMKTNTMYPYPDDPSYQHFIDSLLAQQTVYTLISNEDDWAECPSSEYEDQQGEPISVYCIWATANNAQTCQTEEWADYQIEALSLADFMQDCLINMAQDDVLIGVDFDAQLYGLEIEPMELLGDLLDAAEQQHITLALDNPADLIQQRLEWERWVAGQSRLN